MIVTETDAPRVDLSGLPLDRQCDAMVESLVRAHRLIASDLPGSTAVRFAVDASIGRLVKVVRRGEMIGQFMNAAADFFELAS